MELRNRDEVISEPKPNVLLIGPAKTGKSTGAATGPPGVLFNNYDLPNATRHVHLTHPDGDILEPKLPAEGSNPNAILTHMHEVEYALSQKADVVGTVVSDPVGELYRRLLADLSANAISPSLPTYQAVGVHVERHLRALCVLPVVSVIVAHEWAYEVEGTEGMKVGIWTGTKSGSVSLGQKIMSMVDIIGYTGVIRTETGQKVYVAQVVPASGRQAGDRYDCLDTGDGFIPVNIQEWIKVIKQHEAAVLAGRTPETPERITGKLIDPETEKPIEPPVREPDAAAVGAAVVARERQAAEAREEPQPAAPQNGTDAAESAGAAPAAEPAAEESNENISPATRRRRAKAKSAA